ncbi:MAG: hypothetical protein Q8Q51_05000 [Lutibacter sp.]|nr:hypothetical protein [Lutibacter sp.]
MNENPYSKETKSVVENTEFTVGEVFDFEPSPYKEEFRKTFNFSKGALNLASKYGVDNGLIFFYNDFSVNARAGKSNGFNIIFLNSGLQIWTIQNLFEKNEIHEILKAIYVKEIDYLDNPINVLMYQLTMHFTFYHELAHLVQKSEYLESHLYERPFEVVEFDLTRHKLEIDADSFSGISIATHIQQYALKHFGDDLDSNKMESLIEMFCSSSLLYFLSFQTCKDEIYYYENSHPHPMIRILNIILTITNYLQQSPKLAERKIALNHIKIFKATIKTTSLIETNVLKTKQAENFEKIISTEMKGIVKYISKIRDFKPDNFKLAVDVWNENTKKNNVV